MTPSIAFVVLAAALAAGAACLWLASRRRAAREAGRAARLAEIAARIDAAVSSIADVRVGPSAPVAAPGPPAPPDAGQRPPGRVALLQAAAETIADVRSGGGRLSAAIVRAPDAEPQALAAEAHAAADVPVYTVGPRAVALVLPGLGRADALGVLARIEARCPSSGRAVELEPGEDAVELVARLLAGSGAGSGTAGA